MKTIRWLHVWREGGGVERLSLESNRAVGAIDCGAGPDPFQLEYEARWGMAGSTLFLSYRLRAAGVTHYKSLSTDGAGHWAVDGHSDRRLDDCLDADLWPTPFTNTLAIRRLVAGGRTEATIRVAWVDAFAGNVRPREQRYSQIAPDRWRFESIDDGFAAELLVDEEGLVLEYPGLFRRE